MARKFETDYRIGKTSEVLPTENKFRLDVDLRLDAVELALQQLGSGADTLVARVLRVIEQEISPRAAEIEALLTDYRAGVPAASVHEEADGRQFLTPERRTAILGELRDGVDASGDTLAKLLALIHVLDAAIASVSAVKAPLADAHLTGVPTAPTAALGTNTNQIATMAALVAMRNDLVNGSGASLDQLNELAAALNNDANFGATVVAALSARLRLDAVGGYTPAQKAQGRKNIGVRSASAVKSADFTAGIGDDDWFFELQGSHVMSFAAVAALGDTYQVRVRNTGLGVWVLDPNGSELINGKPNEVLCPGESCTIVCDGGALWTEGLSAEPTIAVATASNSAVVDFANIYSAHFKAWTIRLQSIVPAVNNALFGFRVSVAGVWQQGATDYDCQVWRFTSSATGVSGDVATATYMIVNSGDGLANTGIAGLCGEIDVHLMDGSRVPRFTWRANWLGQGASLGAVGAGAFRSFAAADGFRFLCNNGAITSGEFTLSGRRK
jgi:hypothetical protein